MRLRFLVLVAFAALLVSACQPSASPSAEPSADGSGTGGSIGPLPSLVGDPELEATLPERAGDIVFFQTFSMSGPDFLSAEIDEQFTTFIESLGADIEDVSVAFALGSNSDGTDSASVFAFEVRGAQAEDLIDEFKASAEQGGDPLVWEPQTVAGKSVEVAEPNADFPTPIALYATGDVLYFVSSTDPDAFEEVISSLP